MRARVDRLAALRRALREIDRHVAARDRDTDLDQHRLVVVERVTAEQRLGFVDAVGQPLHGLAAARLGLIEHSLDRVLHHGPAITHDDFLDSFLRQTARGDLRLQVAHRRFGIADVVLDDPPRGLVQPAGVPQLDLIELQALQPRVGRVPGAEPRAQATDVDPVRAGRREPEQLAAGKARRIDHDVVQVLPRDALVIGDHDVAWPESAGAVSGHPSRITTPRSATKCETLPVFATAAVRDVQQAATIVADLVDHHARRALQHATSRWRSRQHAADHLERHDVGAGVKSCR
jgi:hypothetical protein